MNHGTSAKEESRLEEGVRKHVEDRSVKGANTRSHEHVTELANGRVSKNLLDVVLEKTCNSSPESSEHTDHHDNVEHNREEGKHAAETGEQIDTGGHHRCGMDQGRNRSRTRHSIREPGEERNLSRLTRATDEEEDASDRENRNDQVNVVTTDDHADEVRKHIVVEDSRATDRHEAEHTEQEADIAHAVHDERLVRGLAVIDILVPETDEEVRAEAHAFPTEEREEQVVREHEHDHAEQEEVDVGEVTGKAAVAVHVTDRVESDEGADARHEQEHDAGKTIEQESDIHAEHRDVDPVAERFTDATFRHVERKEGNTSKGERREEDCESSNETFSRTLLAVRRNDGDSTEDNASQQREERYQTKRNHCLLPLHVRIRVGVNAFTVAENEDDHGKADASFSGSDCDGEQRNHLAHNACLRRERLCKAHEGEVHGVQGEFNAHQHKEHIAARDRDHEADGENDQGQDLNIYSLEFH